MSAVALERVSPHDYTSFMECRAGDEWVPQLISQASTWLRKKGFDVDLSSDGDHVHGGRRLAVRHLVDADTQDIHLSLVEDIAGTGTWTTELIAHDQPGGGDWISVIVRNDRGSFASVPGLARFIMETLPVGDGRLEYTSAAQTFHEHDVDRLIAIMADRERHGLLFVAATSADDDIPFDAFRDKVSSWLREVAGLAQVVVLDPIASAAFNARIGGHLQVPPWSIRTYRPGVELGSVLAARQHRILGTQRLGAERDGRLARMLGGIAREHAAERLTDGRLQRVRRKLERNENRLLVGALHPSPPDREESPTPLPVVKARTMKVRSTSADRSTPRNADKSGAMAALVKRIFEIEEVTEDSLRAIARRLGLLNASNAAVEQLEARVDDLQMRVFALEDEKSAAEANLREEQEEHAFTHLLLEDQESRTRFLTARLAAANDYTTQYDDVPSEFADVRPQSFDALLERVATMDGIEFTGDEADVVAVSQADTNDAALRSAWDAVETLKAYREARLDGSFDGNLKQFVDSGRSRIGPKKYAHTESEQTMKQFGEDRVFNVPHSVEQTGVATMVAHFKLARIGMTSPRMYVLDKLSHDRTVYIGYIGAHLRNTQTN